MKLVYLAHPGGACLLAHPLSDIGKRGLPGVYSLSLDNDIVNPPAADLLFSSVLSPECCQPLDISQGVLLVRDT